MKTVSPESAHRELLEHVRVFLKQHPCERENSSGQVERRLTVEHMKAALWLQAEHGMVMDMFNLHNVIAFWETARVLGSGAARGAAVVVSVEQEFKQGEFNPRYLLAYFLCEEKKEL